MPSILGVVASHRIPTTISPIPTTGLAGWWDANDAASITASSGAVSQWNDKSGNLRHLIQTVAANKPTTGTRTLNGKNALDFTDDWVSSAAPITYPWVVFLVIKSDVGPSGARMVPISGSANSAFISSQDGDGQWYVQGNGYMYFNRYRDTSSHLISVVSDSSGFTSFYDGVQTNTQNTGNNWGFLSLNFGAANGGGLPFDGLIAEVLIYDRVLSTVERQQVESYLTNKWLDPTGGQIPAAGLSAWYDASDASTLSYSSGSVVSQWRDKSGNGRNANVTVGTPTIVPGSMNSRSTLYITGFPCRLEIASFASAFTTTELFAVFQIKTLGSGSRSQMLSQWGTNAEVGWYPFAGGPSLYENWGIAERPNVGGLNNAILLAPHIYNIRLAPGSITAVINGATIGTSAATVAFRNGGLYLLGNDFGNEPPDGYIAEIVMYNRVLSTVERQQVEQYLKTKWGTP